MLGFCSCTLSFTIFASCETRDGNELCNADTPCEATLDMGVICEKAGAETIGGIVAGSTLTFAVGMPPTPTAWRPIIDPFTEGLVFEVGPGIVTAGAPSIFVMV
uniref:Uncharacterized protein n=1 Tax=Arundo donax TaxID=35708 RepID=A0A0A9HG75_ARUDO